jgi:ATP-dependent helicase HrpA
MASDIPRYLQLKKKAARSGSNSSGAQSLREDLLRLCSESAQKVRSRMATVPVPQYDPALPNSDRRNEIVRAISDNQVVVISGDTGSGKTTQIPKMCLEAGRGTRGLIGCTQPRRIAASAMAERVAEELNGILGQQVGYQVRFRQKLAENCLIKFMTDGILLAETSRDRHLNIYDTIIIDEAHERSLNIDFLLGYLKQLLPRRPDLKLIITSATIDTQKFARHFDDAPVIEVSGRGYPVDMIYQPLDEDDPEARRTDKDLYHAIGTAVRKLDGIDPRGDILVFLSGEREIRESGEYLSRQGLKHTEVLPLYARLSHTEQHRIFHPGPLRRIILSTNVAETSLTVPGIRFVIDSGLARVSRYSHRSRIQRLPIEPVSQASADQRAGRCGRTGPGTCIRLYSETDYDGRELFTEPEVLRTSLASVILRMLVMGLGTVEDFPFVDPPAPRMINDAYNLLKELKAIDDSHRPTSDGKQMVQWPLDVRLVRMIMEGSRLNCLEEMLVLTSVLSIQDPRERPLDKQAKADEAHRRFDDDQSDFAGLLKLWRHVRDARQRLTGNQFRKHCRDHFLNWRRVMEWFDLHRQLAAQAATEKLTPNGNDQTPDEHHAAVHQALLSGLLSHVGLKQPEDRSYLGIRSRSFHIFPSSGLFGRSPKWLMSAEIVETSKSWGRINASIRPEWIEQQGAHLLKRRIFDPHWSRRAGKVMAWEQVSLFGLVIVEKRRVHFAPLDPVQARKVFILEALVRGELDTRSGFMAHNEEIRASVEQMEEKRRKRDVLAHEDAQTAFFEARIPEDVHSSASFEKWLKQIGKKGRQQLFLAQDVLLRDNAGEAPVGQFPDSMEIGEHRFPLTYRFEPGHEHDGVCLDIPLEFLNILNPGRLEWLVPGMLRDKVVELIKQTPKPIRRALTPAQAFADAALESMGRNPRGSMLNELARSLNELSGLDVSSKLFDEEAIDPHFRFLIRVTDVDGSLVAAGRNLKSIQDELGKRAQRKFMDRQGGGYNRDGLTDFTVDNLEHCITTQNGVPAWPALIDQGDAAGLRLFDTEEEAISAHRAGVLRLVSLSLSDKIAYLNKHHGISRGSLMGWSSVGNVSGLVSDLVESSLSEAAGSLEDIRTRESFDQVCTSARSRVGGICRKYAEILENVLAAWTRAGTDLAEIETRRPEVWHDITTQLEDLVYEGFLGDIGSARLSHYTRYLKAVEVRLRNLRDDPGRDATRMLAVKPWWDRYLDWIADGNDYDERVDEYRWLIEEYRVSLFAQRLGTVVRVSEKRLADAWRNVAAD